MRVVVDEVAGYKHAIRGLALNKNQDPEKIARQVAPRLAGKDWGHDKFLRQIWVWCTVTAPRFWWQELDVYRVGMTGNGEDGTSVFDLEEGEIITQSASTMNSLISRPLDESDFEHPLPPGWMEYLNYELQMVRENKVALDVFKSHLPEGFLQERVLALNYATIYGMILTRATHRLPQWRAFIKALYLALPYPELLPVNKFDL